MILVISIALIIGPEWSGLVISVIYATLSNKALFIKSYFCSYSCIFFVIFFSHFSLLIFVEMPYVFLMVFLTQCLLILYLLVLQKECVYSYIIRIEYIGIWCICGIFIFSFIFVFLWITHWGFQGIDLDRSAPF